MAESWTKQHFRLDITSRCPLKAAWCSAVRPALSDTFTLLSSGTRASAQRTALFAAAIWSGVCQFLSRAFTSAECLSNTWTASCKKSSHVGLSCIAFGFLKNSAQQCVIQNQNNIHIPHCRRPQPGAEEWATCYLWHLLWHLQVRGDWLSGCLWSYSYVTSHAMFPQKIHIQFCNISICISTRTEQTA